MCDLLISNMLLTTCLVLLCSAGLAIIGGGGAASSSNGDALPGNPSARGEPAPSNPSNTSNATGNGAALWAPGAMVPEDLAAAGLAMANALEVGTEHRPSSGPPSMRSSWFHSDSSHGCRLGLHIFSSYMLGAS